MKRGALILLVAFPLFACSSAEFRPRVVGGLNAGVMPVDALLLEGRGHLANHNFALAIGSYRRAIRQSPGSIEAYRGLATAYEALGRNDLAGRYFQEALARAPSDVTVLNDYESLQGRVEASEARNSISPVASAAAVASFGSASHDRVPRLERLSTGEVALVTNRGASEVQAATQTGNRPGQPLPIHLVRNTGRELVFALGDRSQPVRPTTAPLRILNAVGRLGQAGRMRGYLQSRGWSSLSVGDAATRRDSSLVIAPAGKIEEARALARTLPFPVNLRASSRVGPIMLVLGTNAVSFDETLSRSRRST